MEQSGVWEWEMAARTALEAGALGRTLAIGAHILKHYPRALEAHLLVGEALRRRGHAERAEDFLLRAQSADPEAPRAYDGLSHIAAARGDLATAIWRAERAVAVAPWDASRRQWLRRLYARWDGIERQRVPLTRAALVRLYMAAGALWKARGELEPLLDEVPQRLDLRVALIEVLWRLEEYQEMALHCERVLRALPHCWKANLWLGLQRRREGRRWLAAGHLARAQATDPAGERTARLLGPVTQLPWAPASIPPWDGTDLPLWEEVVAKLRARGVRAPRLDRQEVAWLQEEKEG